MAWRRWAVPSPVFLGVVGTSFQLHGVATAAGQFMLFGLGMGVVPAALTITTALLGKGSLTRVRGLGRHVGWAGAVILWLAGAYVLYYWITALRLFWTRRARHGSAGADCCIAPDGKWPGGEMYGSPGPGARPALAGLPPAGAVG